MTGGAGAGSTGSASAVGGGGSGSGSGSGAAWTGIFGSIFGFDGGAAPNVHNYSEGDQDTQQPSKARTDQDDEIPDDEIQGEDIQDDDLSDGSSDQSNVNAQPAQPLGDHLALSDEMQDLKMNQPEGKKPTSLWPPRKT
jgi:hypothetical protein